MSIHYDAFISYRHAPVDSAVAADVQKQLERFPVPRAIRQRTGKKRIRRIFRDKEELPITSDLNDDITTALENADRLIVVCSPRTGESLWVQKEIETFLRDHSRHQVLTVLAEGEPSEVIPEILRFDEVPDPITGETVRVPVEPLACDWRPTDHRTRRAELLRLAASVLGCGYDELRQRRRQYVLQQATAALAAVLVLTLGFLAYFIRTNRIIRQSYAELEASYALADERLQQALENQSHYLAAEAALLLENGDRLSAAALALAALPDEENDRPLVPEAQAVLTQAVRAYAVPADDTPVPLQLYEGADKLSALLTGRDTLIGWGYDSATVWDLDGGGVRFMLSPGLYIRDAAVTADDTLLLTGGAGTLCCSLADGTVLWRGDAAGNDLHLSPDGELLLVHGWEDIILYDTATGERLAVQHFDSAGIGCSAALFGGGTGSLLFGAQSTDDWIYDLCLMALSDGEVRQPAQRFDVLNKVFFSADGSVLVAAGRLNGADADGIFCYDTATLTLLWQREVSSGAMADIAAADDAFVLADENRLHVLEPDSGEVRHTQWLPAEVQTMEFFEYNALRLILSDGRLVWYNVTDGTCETTEAILPASSVCTVTGAGWFAETADGAVLRCTPLVNDSWRQLAADSKKVLLCGGLLLAQGTDGLVRCIDPADGTELWCRAADTQRNWRYAGYWQEKNLLLALYTDGRDYGGEFLALVDLSDGSAQTHFIKTSSDFASHIVSVWGDGELLRYACGEQYGDYTFGTFDPAAGTAQERTTDLKQNGLNDRFDRDKLLYLDDADRLWLYDAGRDAAVQVLLPENIRAYLDGGSTHHAVNAAGTRWATTFSGDVIIADFDGSVHTAADIGSAAVLQLCFAPDDETLLAFCGDGWLRSIAPDGTVTLLVRICSAEETRFDGSMRLCGGQELALITGSTLYLVDLAGRLVLCTVENGLAYDENARLFLTDTAADRLHTVGVFERYTLPQLYAMGKALTGSYTLSHGQKAAYGLT